MPLNVLLLPAMSLNPMPETVDTSLYRYYQAMQNSRGQVLHQDFYFHDIHIMCRTNHPTLMTLLEGLLGRFPKPDKIRGEAEYALFCYDDEEHFPVQLPRKRQHTKSVDLLTGTRLKYSFSPPKRDRTRHGQSPLPLSTRIPLTSENVKWVCTSYDGCVHYHSYAPQPFVNDRILSAISPEQHWAITQLTALEHYDLSFLRRYVLILTLGEIMHSHGFVPCHAAAVTAPWDDQQGALLLGASGSGKTSLSLSCASTGCGLLGDDLLLLRQHDQDARVYAHSITSEVSVRSATLDLWPALSFLKAAPTDTRGKRYSTIEQIRVGAARRQTPIALIIFPTLIEDAHSSLTPLSKAATLQELVTLCMSKNDSYFQSQEQLFSLLGTMTEQAQGYQLSIARGDTSGPEMLCSLFTGAPL